MREQPNEIVVLHSVERWLPLTQNWIHTQIIHLSEKVRNHVVCLATENLSDFGIRNIHEFSQRSFFKRKYYGFLRRIGFPKSFEKSLIKRHGIHLVHSHFGNVAWGNIPLSIPPAACRHVATFYGFDVNFLPREILWRTRYQQLFASVDRILCEGPHMAKCLVNLGCPESKVLVHHLGVDIEKITFRPRRWNPKEPLKVLMAASFVEKKGFTVALEALAELQREVNLQITIIGDATRDPRSAAEKARMLAILNESGLSQKTRMPGYVPANVLREEAYQHHLFLSPSVTAANGDTEGGAPVAIIEMAASGMPIVSTAHCDIPNVVIDGVTGFLAPERNSRALAGLIRELIGHPERWSRIAEAGRNRVEREFNARIQARRLESIYTGLCSN